MHPSNLPIIVLHVFHCTILDKSALVIVHNIQMHPGELSWLIVKYHVNFDSVSMFLGQKICCQSRVPSQSGCISFHWKTLL